jgi:hypothetical protein
MIAARGKQPSGILDDVQLHQKACARLHVLLEECRAFQGAGKVQDARRVFAQIERTQRDVTRLEDALRPKAP